MRLISNFLQLPGLLVFISHNLQRQRRFIEAHINPIIHNIDKNQDGSLSNRDFEKIRKYYALAVPAILGEGFSLLRGRALTERERFALTYLGALTGLYDDLFDHANTPEDHIIELTINPNEKIAINSHELLFISFYKKALEYCPNPELLKLKFHEIFNAQVLSKRQKDATISEDELSSITYFKGGLSHVFYCHVLDGGLNKEEERILYTLGKTLQLENDIFDVYKDNQDKINTLVTRAKNISELRAVYASLQKETSTLVNEASVPPKNKRLFNQFFSLLMSMGYVCLHQLEQNEKHTNDVFSVDEYTRKQLVCDMEKWTNKFRAIGYFLRS